MSFVTRFINRPAKALIAQALAPFAYTIQPTKMVAQEGWMGLPHLPIRMILDIGALYGRLSSDTLAPLFPQAKIHCFEPSPAAFAKLKDRAAGSGGRLTAHHMGLGEDPARLSFTAALDTPAASSLLPATKLATNLFPAIERSETVEVEVRRLDDVVAEGLVTLEDDLLVKIDVQGFEDRVIRGGTKTLARARACIIEIQAVELYDGQPQFKDIFALMDGLGFTFEGCLEQYFGPDGQTLYFDAVFMKAK